MSVPTSVVGIGVPSLFVFLVLVLVLVADRRWFSARRRQGPQRQRPSSDATGTIARVSFSAMTLRPFPIGNLSNANISNRNGIEIDRVPQENAIVEPPPAYTPRRLERPPPTYPGPSSSTAQPTMV